VYIAIVFSLITVLITASSNVLLKKGFFRIEPFLVVYLTVAISSFFLWVCTFTFIPKIPFHNYKGILIFVLIGSFAPTLVRTLTYYGIHTLGAGRAAPLRALTPFFAVIMAIIFLKENPNFLIFLGILCIILGVVTIGRDRHKSIEFPYKISHFLYPLAAAFLAGIAANMRKYGLNLMPEPIFAATIAATSALFFLTLYIMFKRKQYIEKLTRLAFYKKEFIFITVAAFLITAGEITDLLALNYGCVSLVVPIFAITPFAIILLSHIFLKKQEKMTINVIYGVLLIVLGVCITIWSNLSSS